jgi:hypothetical protein
MKQLLAILISLPLLCSVAFAGDYNFSFKWCGGNRKCTDILPAPAFAPTSLAFGNHSTGTTTDEVVTLSNSGNGVLSAAELAVTGTSFSLLSTTCGTNPFDLAASTNCTATVRFAPATAASFTGALTLSAPNLDDLVVALSGAGVEYAPSGPLLTDTFDTDTLANYTVFTATAPIYDATNHRPKGQTAATAHGIYYPTAAATNNYEVSCLSYYYSSGFSGPFFNGDGATTSSTGYYFRPSLSSSNLERRNSDGSTTYVSSWAYPGGKTWTATATHLAKIVVTSGTTFHLYVDWSDDGDYGDADEDLGTKTDATYSGNYAGLYIYGLTSFADNIIIQEN